MPKFDTEQAERAFWDSHDSTGYVDWENSSLAVFPNLKKTTKSISLRLPESMLAKLKAKANSMDVPLCRYAN